MNRPLRCLLVLSTAVLVTVPARAELVVIVNPDNPVQSLTPAQVSDLYLGRSRSLGSGKAVQILDWPRDSAMRKAFFERINGMPLRQVNAYWARLQFSGEVQPPAEVSNSRDVIEVVRHNPHAIGYVEASELGSGVRPVLRLKN